MADLFAQMDDFARREVAQRDRPRGVLLQDNEQRIKIWVKTWNQIIAECRTRLNFFAQKLSYHPHRDASLRHLETSYERYLGDLSAADAGKELEPAVAEPVGA